MFIRGVPKNEAVELPKQQATALFLLGHPVCITHEPSELTFSHKVQVFWNCFHSSIN